MTLQFPLQLTTMSTIRELKAQASALRIKGYSRMNKAALEAAIAELTTEEQSTMSNLHFADTEFAYFVPTAPTEETTETTTSNEYIKQAAIAAATVYTTGKQFYRYAVQVYTILVIIGVLCYRLGQITGKAYYSRYHAQVTLTAQTAVQSDAAVATSRFTKTALELAALAIRYAALKASSLFLLGLARLLRTDWEALIIQSLTISTAYAPNCFANPYAGH